MEPAEPVDTLTSYKVITRSLSTTLSRTAATPAVARETAYYKENIAKATTIDAFVNDRRLLNYALKAWGLEDMSYAKGMIKKVLEGGVDDPRSLANTLQSGRFKEFAKTFNYKTWETATPVLEGVKTKTVDNYVRQTLEQTTGETNAGVQLALYFERKAPNITSTYSILADRNLLKVVQTALGIPASMSASNIDSQVAMIEQKLDVADFKDPEKLGKFLARFAATYDAANSTATAPNVILGGGGFGLNANLLLSIQKTR